MTIEVAQDQNQNSKDRSVINAENISSFLQRVSNELIEKIRKATIPIYAIQNDRVVRDRSGVLLKVGDDCYILTASHDLREIVQNNIYLYAGWSQIDLIPVPIANDKILYHTSDRDVYDIAAIKLTRDVAADIMSSSKPVTLLDVADNCPDESHALYLVCGYPRAWLKVLPNCIESPPLHYLCRSYHGDPLAWTNLAYDPRVHLLLNFTQDAIHIQSQKHIVLPDTEGIKGISGCGVWRIIGDFPRQWRDWKIDDVKLVGIEHTYWESKGVAAATRIQFMNQFLADSYPEVIAAMNIVYGRSRQIYR